jgi:glycosyltransferase involved in cell wall biosynthesis
MSLVSAIIPTYNRADLLERALVSVAQQDHRLIEAIVIDDGSTDGTPQVLDELKPVLAERGVELITHRQQNERAPKARNTAMKMARGDYFAFLDSDDLWRPRHVSTLLKLLAEQPQAGLAFCGIQVVNLNDRVIMERATHLPPDPKTGVLPRPFDRIVRHMPFQTSAVILPRRVIDDVGDFDLGLPVVEDWDLWYRISKKYDFVYTTECLACNREHPDNLPKFSLLALRGNLRMNLRHLPDVHDPGAREALTGRIRWHMLILQEELLRQGAKCGDDVELLDHPLAPTTMRYRCGRSLRSMPRWMGRTYARMVKWLGQKTRGEA